VYGGAVPCGMKLPDGTEFPFENEPPNDGELPNDEGPLGRKDPLKPAPCAPAGNAGVAASAPPRRNGVIETAKAFHTEVRIDASMIRRERQPLFSRPGPVRAKRLFTDYNRLFHGYDDRRSVTLIGVNRTERFVGGAPFVACKLAAGSRPRHRRSIRRFSVRRRAPGRAGLGGLALSTGSNRRRLRSEPSCARGVGRTCRRRPFVRGRKPLVEASRRAARAPRP